MHPLLADRRRLLLYLAAWLWLAGLTVVVMVMTRSVPWLEATLIIVPLDLGYALVCLAAFFVCRTAPLGTTDLTRVAITQLGAALVSSSAWLGVAGAWVGLLAETGLVPDVQTAYQGIRPAIFPRALMLYLLAAGLHYLLEAFEASRRAEAQALEFQILSRDAELRALRAQIHPHFLFNALNSISALVTARPDEARRVCILLADFLRRSLTYGARDHVSLGDELALAEELLAIEKVRFGARLGHETRADEAARACSVPALLLQPLMENAVTHGISQCLDGGTVRVEATRHGERLHVVIENPRDPDTPRRKGTGIGLDNVRRRLQAVYGREAEMEARAEGLIFRVELSLPVEVEEEA
jgi:two-component system sensor histidine kinase AlgZ